MSNVSNRHNVVPFVSGKSQPLTGQELVVCSFKQTAKMTKAGKKALPSVCVSVPALPALTAEHFASLNDVVRDLLDGARRDIVSALYVKNQAIGSVSDEEIGIDACIEFLNTSTGGRLTSEALGTWFDSTMVDIVTAAVIEKLCAIGQMNADQEPQDRHLAIIASTVAQQREYFCALASGVTKYEPAQCEGLCKLLAQVEPDDDGAAIAARLTKRLQKMAQPVVKMAQPDAIALF